MNPKSLKEFIPWFDLFYDFPSNWILVPPERLHQTNGNLLSLLTYSYILVLEQILIAELYGG